MVLVARGLDAAFGCPAQAETRSAHALFLTAVRRVASTEHIRLESIRRAVLLVRGTVQGPATAG